MIRNLKMYGLALVAVFVMSSLVASAASAALPDTDVFTSEAAPVKYTYTQENGLTKFTLAGQSVECTGASMSATVNALETSEVLTEVPSYSGCTYAGQEASVTMNGCKYRFTGTTNTEGDAKVHLVCSVGARIVMFLKAIVCKVLFGTQETLEGYSMTTVGSGTTRELTMHVTTKITVTSEGSPSEGVTCASLTAGTGTYEGTYLITGENPTTSAHIGITDHTIGTP